MQKPLVSIASTVAPLGVAALVTWAVADGVVRRGGLPAVAWCVIAAFVINWIAFIPSWIKRTEHFFDLVGSLTYVSVTALALVLAPERNAVNWLLAILIFVWAARLGSFLFMRIRAAGSDRRFNKIKTDPLRLLSTWTLQGLWVSLTAIAAWTAMTALDDASFGALGVIGLIVWLVGFGIEVRADAEKNAFRKDPSNDGRFISTGIWAWSRHPNYFGEITLWVGIALIALPRLDGWRYVALISPLFVFVLLSRISGVPALERRGKKRWGDDPEYQRYVANTPVLLMKPPS